MFFVGVGAVVASAAPVFFLISEWDADIVCCFGSECRCFSNMLFWSPLIRLCFEHLFTTQRIVDIMCNDCETKSQNRLWHFLGIQCPQCNSFNTVVEQVVSTGPTGNSSEVPSPQQQQGPGQPPPPRGGSGSGSGGNP